MTDLKLYGLRISYYTGKMEAYLRYKEIDHEFIVLNRARMRLLKAKTGAAQMPAIELSDGRFMTDTTPMMAWLEKGVSLYASHTEGTPAPICCSSAGGLFRGMVVAAGNALPMELRNRQTAPLKKKSLMN